MTKTELTKPSSDLSRYLISAGPIIMATVTVTFVITSKTGKSDFSQLPSYFFYVAHMASDSGFEGSSLVYS
jgi:hypothetical protein